MAVRVFRSKTLLHRVRAYYLNWSLIILKVVFSFSVSLDTFLICRWWEQSSREEKIHWEYKFFYLQNLILSENKNWDGTWQIFEIFLDEKAKGL